MGKIKRSQSGCSFVSLSVVPSIVPPGCVGPDQVTAGCVKHGNVGTRSSEVSTAPSTDDMCVVPSQQRCPAKAWGAGSVVRENDEDDVGEESPIDHIVGTGVSFVFMVLVGLSMPLLIGPNAEDSGSDMSALAIIGHIIVVSILMILGKMFPLLCYREEATIKERVALCLGMCPRGEVGASIIVLSLQLGIRGPILLIAMGSLSVNLIFSGAFIAAVKLLLRNSISVTGLELVATEL